MNTKTGLQVLTLTVALVGASAVTMATAALAQDDAVAQSEAQEQAGTTDTAAKSDLDGSVVRVVTSNEAARASTTVSLRRIVLPRILGTYR